MSDPGSTIEQLAAAEEVEIETRDGDRSYRTVIWVVEGDGDLYVRSYRGDTAKWYVRAMADPHVALISGDSRVEFTATSATDDNSVDLTSRGFLVKYAADPYMETMLSPDILHTTMRLDPRSG